MPELSKTLVDEEGVELIRVWIDATSTRKRNFKT